MSRKLYKISCKMWKWIAIYISCRRWTWEMYCWILLEKNYSKEL